MKTPHEFSFDVRVRLTMQQNPGSSRSSIKHGDVLLDCPAIRNFKGDDGLPNASGLKASTIALITGLATNIHHGHAKGMWDSAEHLRYIISELEKQFVMIADITDGNFGEEVTS